MTTLIETRTIPLISSEINSRFSPLDLSTSPKQCPISSKLATHMSSVSNSSTTSCPFNSAVTSSKSTKPLSLCSSTDLTVIPSLDLALQTSIVASFLPSTTALVYTPSSDEPLNLPPLLSLLPTGTPSIEPVLAFDFNLPKVGYTTSRLPSIDPASISLHNALYHFKPISRDYAYSDYKDAFNWNELILDVNVEREWYIVAFRSTRAKGSISQNLYEADREAHEEAVAAGGLLAYWFGAPNSEGSNLATCIWQSRAHAIAASSGEAHVTAMRLASSMYEIYSLERYVLKKVKGEVGVTVEDWAVGRKEVDF